MNALDRLIGYFAPIAAMRRRAARTALAHYEAAEPSRMRKFYRERGSQNEMVQRGAVAVRAQARHLARNHDLARGALRTLVTNVVGAKGIGIEPQPRRLDGSIHSEYAAQLLEAYRDWCRRPEVTHRLPWSRLQRSMARAWLRDGEVFAQMITGLRPDLDHGTRVPFSIEAFEADLVPMDYHDSARNITQGIERNQWGKPLAIHVLKTSAASISLPSGHDTKRIPWDRALHLATLDHIGQIRGVSEFASVITRLEDIKDYEESERVAAKIAAMLTAYVKRGTPDLYEPPQSGDAGPRQINFAPGMIIDDLAVGEEIGLIDSKRPNPNLITFRQGQLRAIAAGVGGSYSSISRDYNGTYSAQRQELVEQWIHYAVLCDEFTGEIVQPAWEQFVIAAHLSGVVRMPADLKPGTEDDALYTAQAMPWIDPVKEATAWQILVQSGFASEVEAIRRRGGNPSDVLEQIADFRAKAAEMGLKFSSQIDPSVASMPSDGGAQ
jgi:lambda family phage portal protein